MELVLEILTELYKPLKDFSTLMEESLKISQQPNERLRVLAGQIENAASKYSETIKLPSIDLDKIIKSRFKHAIANKKN